MNKIRVMIVEDSRVVRELLQHLIEQDPRLEVAVAVASAEEALRVLHRISPDVVSMDIRLPGMDGLEATQRIMQDKPTPIVVVAAGEGSEDSRTSMQALRLGALAVVEKPNGITRQDYSHVAGYLCTQLVLMSQVNVVRQRFNRRRPLLAGSLSSQPHGVNRRPAGGFLLAGIVASTGGPAAVQKVLASLDRGFPIPIALVQHMAEGFLPGFISWLNGVCPFHVAIAREGERPQAGMVYVAPADRHLCIEGGHWHLDARGPIDGQLPSGTRLFSSMASDLGPRSLGLLLTGMGEDGAAGLKALCEAGGYTIAENATTAVVYGMPAAAVRLGAVCESLALSQIAPRLKQLVSLSQGNSA